MLYIAIFVQFILLQINTSMEFPLFSIRAIYSKWSRFQALLADPIKIRVSLKFLMRIAIKKQIR